jgi:hypothetical protein
MFNGFNDQARSSPAERPAGRGDPTPEVPASAQADGLVGEVKRALLSARSALATLEEAHARTLREAMTAELSSWLVDGEPCGLCGSTIHPRPACEVPALTVDASRLAWQAALRLEEACAGLLATVDAPLPDGPADVPEPGPSTLH